MREREQLAKELATLKAQKAKLLAESKKLVCSYPPCTMLDRRDRLGSCGGFLGGGIVVLERTRRLDT
jgi:hypothetical protein